MMDNIERRVLQVVGRYLALDDGLVTKDADLIEDLGADSLMLLELMVALQREFRCKIPDAKARGFTTVAHAVEYLEALA